MTVLIESKELNMHLSVAVSRSNRKPNYTPLGNFRSLVVKVGLMSDPALRYGSFIQIILRYGSFFGTYVRPVHYS